MEKLDLNTAIELHDVAGIRACLESDVPKRNPDQPLIYLLIGEYTRGARFKDCVRVFLEKGHGLKDPILEAVLLDDAVGLGKAIREDSAGIHRKYSLPCAYTPFLEVSLLHICAEFNHLACAKLLVDAGLDINTKAGVDELGFGGQTPIFHTVNQNNHRPKEMLDFCLDQGADLDCTLRGLVWGKGYPWETFIPAVNPISYAMMGLLPQMHRREEVIAEVVSQLMKKRFGIDYQSANIPNKYLKG
ncbi:hypothetical protein J0A68_16765 [Algoriphagus sp. H41]|uniref:Ankyrin repeat domain-containing protein n=1 Tax=Algoriphagus oliviformis TaxID=2811231 RepID=A0ABS3C7R2_9BACT|nr:ankyrin repeat domain-containing protein [Algoriphagus oliviformis]MBN7812609.1 hypothetical protein [Algoriphagus oliviformis]